MKAAVCTYWLFASAEATAGSLLRPTHQIPPGGSPDEKTQIEAAAGRQGWQVGKNDPAA